MSTSSGSSSSTPTKNWEDGEATASKRPAGGRRLRRRLLLAVPLALLLIVGVVVLIAPMVASSMAPGIIESSAAKSIAGSVKVKAVSVGYFSPTKLEGAELYDDKGGLVGRASVDTTFTLLDVISGGWWSAASIDLGKVTIRGDATLIEEADGTTNLQRALAPKGGTAAPAPSGSSGASTTSGGGSAGRAIALQLELAGVSLVREVRAQGASSRAGVEKLQGALDLSVDTRGALQAAAKGALSGTPVGGGGASGASTQAMKIDVDAKVKQRPGAATGLASLDNAAVKVNVSGAPVALIDALAHLGGGLLASAGATADAQLTLDGTLSALKGSVIVSAPGLSVRLPVEIAGGVVRSRPDMLASVAGGASPATFSLRSIEGLGDVPALRPLAKQLGEQVKLSRWPMVEVVTESVALPAPIDAQGSPTQLAAADLRGSSARVRVRIGAMEGTVRVPDDGVSAEAGAAPPQTSGGSATGAGRWAPFSTEAMELVVDAPDFARPVQVSAKTRAMLDGQPAGEVEFLISGDGLLDDAGRLRALGAHAASPGASGAGAVGAATDLVPRLQVRLSVKGLASSLVSPLVKGMDLPLDVAQDLGPSFNLELSARTLSPSELSGAESGSQSAPSRASVVRSFAQIPPVEFGARLDSTNASVQAAGQLTDGVLTSRSGDQALFEARVTSASALARRILADAGQEPRMLADGSARVDMSLSRVRVDLNALLGSAGGKMSEQLLKAVGADVRLALADVAIRLPASGATADAASQPAERVLMGAPLRVRNVEFVGRLAPLQAPGFQVESAMAYDEAMFSAGMMLSFEGLAKGDLGALMGGGSASNPLSKLLALEPVGSITTGEVPVRLLNALAGLGNDASAGPGSNAAAPMSVSGSEPLDVGAMTQDLLGRWVSAMIEFKPDAVGGATGAGVTSVGGSRSARFLLRTESGSTGASLVTKLEPTQVTIVSGSAFVKAEEARVNPLLARFAQQPGAGPMTLLAPATIWARVGSASAVSPAGSPGAVAASGAPVVIPLKDLKPDLDAMSPVRLTLESQGDLGIGNIVVSSGGSAENAGPSAPSAVRTLGVRLVGLSGEVTVPTGALSTRPDRPAIQASLGSRVVRADGAPIVQLAASASISGNRSNGTTIDAQATLDQLATRTLDESLALSGMLQGFVGDTAKLTLRTQTSTASAASGSGASAPVESSLSVAASIEAPRISGASIRLQKDRGRLAIVDPATIVVRPDPAFLNSLAGSGNLPPVSTTGERSAGQAASDSVRQVGEGIGRQMNELFGGKKSAAGDSGGGAAKPATTTRLRVVDADQITLKVARLAISMSEGDAAAATGPLKPGVFDLDIEFNTPKLALETLQVASDGSASFNPTIAHFNGVRGSVKSLAPVAAGASNNTSEGSGLALTFNIDKVETDAPAETGSAAPGSGSTGAGAAAGGRPASIIANVRRLSDTNGVVTTDRAIITADADIDGFPTALLDRLANQGGLMTELLGPTVSLKAQARDVTLPSKAASSAPGPGAASGAVPSGSLNATLKAPRAEAQITGTIAGQGADAGRFVQNGPTRVIISEIRPQLVQVLAGGMPIVDSLEKSRTDRPAVIEMTNLRAPMDGDLAKLDGTISVDIGVARFTTKSVFGELIKAAGGKDQGTIGRKIEPFVVQARAGVLDYERFSLPLGEFNLQTQGQVDLANRQIRVTTYAPFFAIAEEALGPIKLGIGGKINLIDRNTLVPITTRGSLDNPKTSIDTDEFLKGLGKSLIEQPGKAIGDLIGDVLGGGGKKKDKDKK